jgi:hypothetical protein
VGFLLRLLSVFLVGPCRIQPSLFGAIGQSYWPAIDFWIRLASRIQMTGSGGSGIRDSDEQMVLKANRFLLQGSPEL